MLRGGFFHGFPHLVAPFSAINNKQDRLPAGEEGQVWTAGLDGNGSWQAPAGGGAKRLVDSISEVATKTSTGLTVSQDFEIQYIHCIAGSVVYTPWLPVEAGDYLAVSTGSSAFVNIANIDMSYGACYILRSPTKADLLVSCAGDTTGTTLLTEGQSPTSTGTTSSDKSRFYRIRVKA